MRLLIAAMALVLTTVGAFAQASTLPGSQIGQHAQRSSDQTDPAKNAAQRKTDDRAYNAALRNLPNKEYDPWHGVR